MEVIKINKIAAILHASTGSFLCNYCFHRPLFKPGHHIGDDEFHAFWGLAKRERMPHAIVHLKRLIGAGS